MSPIDKISDIRRLPREVKFDGPCPFLLCFATGPHSHPICPKCGTVRYGNMFCDECRKNVDIHRELALIELNAKGGSKHGSKT